MSYTIACANSIFEIFENPALEEDDDFPSAISFDIAGAKMLISSSSSRAGVSKISNSAISKDIALGNHRPPQGQDFQRSQKLNWRKRLCSSWLVYAIRQSNY
ncbi:hypothetical protein BASA62_004165 [Batrachochytrium salamandrivorans]|nr:hypothetical protein BASA62_004165 [Batrachochytrium salamandrivorans]